jgi:anaerobic glycerol-3-phosphate dehydrogenase
MPAAVVAGPLGNSIGFKMMQKFGWQGGGLGAKESGIQEPVKAAEVRGQNDRFKGIGSGSVAPDDYEKYRQQSSERMRAGWNTNKGKKKGSR